jgi:hypothetical protein
MEPPRANKSPWTPAERASLIEGMRAFLLHAPKSISWAGVWESVRDSLPGRTLGAAQQHWGKRLSRGSAATSGEGGRHLSDTSVWTPAENAALAAAVEASTRVVGAHAVDWTYVHLHAPALTGRSTGALGGQWTTLSATPAAQAMLAEVAEVVARGGPGAGAAAAGAAAAAAAPQQPQQPLAVSPFHMLHSLFSSGSLDEATLRVCWMAALAAMQG